MSKSSLNLSQTDLENIRKYRYDTNGYTPLDNAFNPFWEFIANKVFPDWLAPNLITLIGMVVPVIQLIIVDQMYPELVGVFPRWLVALCIFAQFWYQTLDATDGKQARRTDNCSPLGQILDHNLDQLSQTCFMIAVCGIIQTHGNVWIVLLLTPGILSPHFLVEYRTHFTNFHLTAVAGIGATEQICIIMSIESIALFYTESSAIYQWDMFVLGGYVIKGYHLILVIAFSSGFYYNLENLIVGMYRAKDKTYAALCVLPYLQFLVMMFVSSYSRFYETRQARFIIICGAFLLYANCYLNLCTMSLKRYNWLYLEPFVFYILMALDLYQVTTDNQCVMLYLAFFIWICVKYILLMQAIVDQICTYLGIRFLHNKPVTVSKKQN